MKLARKKEKKKKRELFHNNTINTFFVQRIFLAAATYSSFVKICEIFISWMIFSFSHILHMKDAYTEKWDYTNKFTHFVENICTSCCCFLINCTRNVLMIFNILSHHHFPHLALFRHLFCVQETSSRVKYKMHVSTTDANVLQIYYT